jgi:MFS family permease
MLWCAANRTESAMTPRSLIPLLNAAHGMTHYSLLILPTAVLTMAHPGGAFGAEYGPILALATGMFLCYGLFSLPQGWLAARLGRKPLLAAFFFGTAVSLAASGVATTPLALALALAVTGAFIAIYHPVGTALLIEAAHEKPGRAIGVNGVFGNLGVALAPVVTAFLAAQIGWRAAFFVPAAALVVFGLFWLRVPGLEATSRRATAAFPPIPPYLVRRAVIVLLVIAAVAGLVFNAFTVLVPKLMAERLATSHALLPLAGAAATVATLCGALTQFTVGRMIDRMTLRRVFMPMACALVPALLALAFAPGLLAVPLAGLVAASVFGQVTVNETMAARYIAPALRVRLYSLRFFISFLGAAAAPPLVGFLFDATGSLAAPLLLLAACSLVTLGCALFFPDRPEELAPERWAAAAVAAAE